MIDIRRIKEDPAAVKAGFKAKEVYCDATVDRILELDVQVRALKKAGKDVAPVFAEMAALKAGIAEDAAKLDEVLAEYKTLMLSLPNLPDEDLLPGGKENKPC